MHFFVDISARGRHSDKKFGTIGGTQGPYKTAKFQVDRTGNGFLANFQTSFSYLCNGRTYGLAAAAACRSADSTGPVVTRASLLPLQRRLVGVGLVWASLFIGRNRILAAICACTRTRINYTYYTYSSRRVCSHITRASAKFFDFI